MQEIRKTIKKLLPMALLALLVLFASVSKAHSQTIENSIPTTENEIARLQLVNALERAQTEVKSSRKLIAGMKEQVEIKETRIQELIKRDGLNSLAVAALQSEVKNLRAAIFKQEESLKTLTDEVDYLKKTLEKTRKKLHLARKVQKVLIITVATIFTAFLLK